MTLFVLFIFCVFFTYDVCDDSIGVRYYPQVKADLNDKVKHCTDSFDRYTV